MGERRAMPHWWGSWGRNDPFRTRGNLRKKRRHLPDSSKGSFDTTRLHACTPASLVEKLIYGFGDRNRAGKREDRDVGGRNVDHGAGSI